MMACLRSSFRIRAVPTVLALLLAGLALAGGGAHAGPLTFDAALQQLRTGSDKLAAAQAAVSSKALRAEGLKYLGGPVVDVFGASYNYSASLTVNLDPANRAIAQATQMLPAPLQSLPITVSPLPSQYTYTQQSSATDAWVSAVWPLYLGGATDHVRGLAQAQTDEERADAAHTGNELSTLLVQRYFGAQLAARAARLRNAARDNVVQHDNAAQRLLDAGLISRAERLQARVALGEAQRNATRAQDDAELAQLALSSLLHDEAGVEPLSPLFVMTQPLPAVAEFVDLALRHHPGLDKVAAKRAQAMETHESEEALRRPQLFAFGQEQLNRSNPDWIVGVALRWNLWDSVDHSALEASSLRQVEQAERTDAQARADITLLVQRNWRLVESARRQFVGHDQATALAAEVLRLRAAALREGAGTALELIDAETNMAKVQTERAQAAYDYDLALAQLLESCGLSDEFTAYMARADVRLEDGP